MKKIFLALMAVLITYSAGYGAEAPTQVTEATGKENSIFKKFHFKSDYRLRYQWQSETGKANRERVRIRLRAGAVFPVNDKIRVGAGLATGGADPRSTNQTLEGVFQTPDIRLDYAYIEFTPVSQLTLWGGKYKGIKKAIFRPSDLLWDSDLRPDGVGIIAKSSGKKISFFLNAGLFILDEVKSSADPLLPYAQPGVAFDSGRVKIKLGLAYYNATAIKGHQTLPFYSGTNSVTTATGNPGVDLYKYDYDTVNPSLEVKIKNIPLLHSAGLFAEYAQNIAISQDNTAYILGVKLGKKVKKRGDISFKALYRYLEKDAWLDVFPDSDAFGGKTGVKGYEAEIQIGLCKNLKFGIDYYNMQMIGSNKKQQVVQADLVGRF